MVGNFKVVLVIQDRNPLPGWVHGRLTDAGIDMSVRLCWTRDELAQYAGDADVVWSYGGRRGLLEGENLQVLERCGAILRTGSGTDNVDIETATELGIIVTNTPHVVADQVADHAISLLFSLVRLVTYHDRLVRRGVWDSYVSMPKAHRYRGAKLGLVGFGHVGRLMAQKLASFQMGLLAHDLYVSADVMASLGVESVSLEQLLDRADYVSLHCPLTAETHHLIGERELRRMRPQALLINTARGKVVDEAALSKALQEGWIAGAALDVLEKEPPDPDNPLLAMENVILTPHFAGFSDTYPEEFAEASVEAIVGFAERRWPRSVVNPTVEPRWGKLSPYRGE